VTKLLMSIENHVEKLRRKVLCRGFLYGSV